MSMIYLDTSPGWVAFFSLLSSFVAFFLVSSPLLRTDYGISSLSLPFPFLSIIINYPLPTPFQINQAIPNKCRRPRAHPPSPFGFWRLPPLAVHDAFSLIFILSFILFSFLAVGEKLADPGGPEKFLIFCPPFLIRARRPNPSPFSRPTSGPSPGPFMPGGIAVATSAGSDYRR